MFKPSITPKPTPLALNIPDLLLRFIGQHLHAGFPSPATDYLEEKLNLHEYLVSNPVATFMFDVAGESMRGAGIHSGDKVAVDRSINAMHDDIVVACVDGEFTLKRLYKRAGRIELHPDNPDFKPIVISADTELQIWGVVVSAVRRYHQRAKPPARKVSRGG
jgi:DNA polymerase V